MAARSPYFCFSAILMAATVAPALEPPQTVSPGTVAEVATTPSSCPVFSWAPVSDAGCYELVVVPVGSGDGGNAAPDPLLRQILPGTASTWTPPGAECLENGRRYAWTIRSGCDGSPGVWSEPRLFEVRQPPEVTTVEEAVRVLEEYTEANREPEPAGQPLPPPTEAALSPNFNRITTPPDPVPRAPVAPGSMVIDGDYAFSGTKGVTLRISPFSFALGDEAVNDRVRRSTAGFTWIQSGTSPYEVYLLAPIRLPEQSQIVRFGCRIMDDSPNHLTAWAKLRRRYENQSTNNLMATVDLRTNGQDSTTLLSRNAPSVSYATVDNRYFYYVTLQWNPDTTGEQFRFYGCEIRYVVTELTP